MLGGAVVRLEMVGDFDCCCVKVSFLIVVNYLELWVYT